MFNGKNSDHSFGRDGSNGGQSSQKKPSGEINSAHKPTSKDPVPPRKPKK